MRQAFYAFGLASAAIGIGFGASGQVSEPRLDRREGPSPDYVGPLFVPSYDFPATLPAPEPRPWEAIDFRTDPAGYMNTVLAYVMEGQDRTTWRVQDNPVRKWFHMPWMGPGPAGREFTHGLTSERRSRPGELGSGQTKCRQNWAVGFYNPQGGFLIGKVWKPVADGAGAPDLSQTAFPVGTVVAKLLYTEASEIEVPILAGAPSIAARIHADPDPSDDRCPNVDQPDGTPSPRTGATLRLLQVDVAVRDTRADASTGWIFGTFIYDGREPGTDPWAKLRPVGLMWGNDPQLTDDAAAAGQRPVESIVLSDFGFGRGFGRGGRMNGPVDNPASACSSCHMSAQFRTTAPMSPPRSWTQASCWFRNLGPTTAFGAEPRVDGSGCGTTTAGQVSLDYSLQMAAALRNHEFETRSVTKSILGLPFLRRPARLDERVRIDGVRSYPVTRDEAEQDRR